MNRIAEGALQKESILNFKIEFGKGILDSKMRFQSLKEILFLKFADIQRLIHGLRTHEG